MKSYADSYEINFFSPENIKRCILPYYDLNNFSISQIKFKDSQKQRAVYKVENSGKAFCLKKVYYSKEELLFIYSVMEWLSKSGINIPKILPTNFKGRFVEFNDMLFILTKWINGTKCSYDNMQNVIDSIYNLSKIHFSGENFIPIKGSFVRNGFEDISNSAEKHLEQLLLCSNQAFNLRDDFSKIFLENFSCNYVLAKYSTKIASSINKNNLSRSLCHLDYVNKNIIFDASNSLWVIDFDKCRFDYCIHDVSYFLRRFLKRNATNWNIDLAIKCLKAYEKKCPLNLDEFKYLLSYLAFPQKFWKISKDYFNNINKCNKKSFQNLICKSVLNDSYHLEFTKELSAYIENRFNIKLTSG